MDIRLVDDGFNQAKNGAGSFLHLDSQTFGDNVHICFYSKEIGSSRADTYITVFKDR
jgi:hypothetical protein